MLLLTLKELVATGKRELVATGQGQGELVATGWKGDGRGVMESTSEEESECTNEAEVSYNEIGITTVCNNSIMLCIAKYLGRCG